LRGVAQPATGKEATILRCAKCDTELAPDANFCSHCGRQVHKPFVPQRKRATVLICDFVDSTGLTIELADEANELFDEARALIRDIVRQHRGDADRAFDRIKSGDSLLFCFGLVQSQDDAAERAVRVGLRAVREVEQIRTKPGVVLRIRVGIASGFVFPLDEQISGEPVILAARLHEEEREPGSIIICSETRRRIGELFDCQDLGERQLKGFRELKHIWRVRGERSLENRFELMHPEISLTPLAGRSEEITRLLEHWQLARQGRGQVVLVSGAAGIGKSRMLRELQHRLKDAQPQVIRLQCASYYVNSAFAPIVAFLQRSLHYRPGDSGEAKLDKLEALIAGLVAGKDEVKDLVRLIAPVLSLAAEQRHGQLILPQKEQKQQTVDAFVRLVSVRAARQPLLVLFEDAHWADPSTLHVLGRLSREIAEKPLKLLLAITCRHDELSHQAEFEKHLHVPGVQRLRVKKLSRRDARALVSSVSVQSGLSSSMVSEIIARADGVPLFLEEVTKLMVQRGTPPSTAGVPAPALNPASVPETLHDSLSKRLERLSPAARSVAQAGATIGQEFSYQMLLMIGTPSFLQKEAIDDAVDELVRSGLIFARSTRNNTVFSFKHAAIHDVALSELGQRRRQDLHAKIASVLEPEAQGYRDERPELLAHHYTEARLYDKAVEYWKRAGDLAARRSANQEAIAHLEKGLSLLALCADAPERKHQQLELYATLVRTYIAQTGFTSEQVRQTLAHAEALLPHVRESANKFVVLRASCQRFLVEGEYEAARRIGEQLQGLADEEDNSSYRLDAHLMLGLVSLYRGELLQAQMHLERCVMLYDPAQHLDHAIRQGIDIGSACRSYLARALWLLGYADSALEHALSGANTKTPSIPLGIAQASFMLALTYHMRGDTEAARAATEETMRYAKRQGHAYFIAAADILFKWMSASQKKNPAAVRQLTASIRNYLALNSKLGLSWFLLLRAAAHRHIGQYEQGLTDIEEAFAHVQRTGETFYAAEIYRVKGELLLARPHLRARAEAEECFQRSLEIARSQHAKSWELRTCISLATLWEMQGKRHAARDLLHEVCAWFEQHNQGIDTADFRESQRLLQKLAPVPTPTTVSHVG
jgi:predicted ATPase/class 3 adenylate cyclase